MHIITTLKRFRSYWLVTGLVSFGACAAYSLSGTLDGLSASHALAASLDWVTASTIYFFLGALLGHILDQSMISSSKRTWFPAWVTWTLLLWATSSVLSWFSSPERPNPLLTLFFPWAYGIFFTSFGFTALVPFALEASTTAKSAFNILVLGCFAFWVWVSSRNTLLRKILLGILFLAYLLGAAGCALQLGR